MEKVLSCEVFTVGYWLRLLGGSSNLPGQKSISTSQQLAKKPVYAPSPRVHLLGKVNSKSQGCFKSGYMSKTSPAALTWSLPDAEKHPANSSCPALSSPANQCPASQQGRRTEQIVSFRTPGGLPC